MPAVLNFKRHRIPTDAVYIGRGSFLGKPSKWGNPFVLGQDGTRDEVCDQYEEWLRARPELMASLHELRGRDLVCFCAPYRCHGDLLLRLANQAER